jgi:hypothetical protein
MNIGLLPLLPIDVIGRIFQHLPDHLVYAVWYSSRRLQQRKNGRPWCYVYHMQVKRHRVNLRWHALSRLAYAHRYSGFTVWANDILVGRVKPRSYIDDSHFVSNCICFRNDNVDNTDFELYHNHDHIQLGMHDSDTDSNTYLTIKTAVYWPWMQSLELKGKVQ